MQKHFAEAFIYWSTVLFYYDRSMGVLQQLALMYLSEYLSLLVNTAEMQFKREQVMALSQVCSWCKQDGKVEEQQKICSKLYNIYEDQTLPDIKKMWLFYVWIEAKLYAENKRRSFIRRITQ